MSLGPDLQTLVLFSYFPILVEMVWRQVPSEEWGRGITFEEGEERQVSTLFEV